MPPKISGLRILSPSISQASARHELAATASSDQLRPPCVTQDTIFAGPARNLLFIKRLRHNSRIPLLSQVLEVFCPRTPERLHSLGNQLIRKSEATGTMPEGSKRYPETRGPKIWSKKELDSQSGTGTSLNVLRFLHSRHDLYQVAAS